MKKIFKFAAIVAAAAALFSCQEKPTPEPTPDPEKPNQEKPDTPQINENIKFTIELTEVTHELAKFKIKHDGVKADTWHYFSTTESDITKAIETEVAKIMEEGKSLQSSTSKTVTERGLEAETKYSLVVFGLSTKGEVYGQPATFEFTTTAAPLEGFQVNSAWTITYIGDHEQEGQLFTHVAMLESTDENPYFLTAWPKAAFEQTGIEAVAEGEIAAWLEYLSGSQYTFADVLTVGSTMETFADVIDTQYGLEWYIIAIGAEPEGKATGYYAISDLITIVEEDMTEEYAAWLGDWTFTGANGVAWPITFSKGKANKSFIMTGWEGFGDLGVEVEWDATNQIWAAMIQNLGTFEFQGGKTGDIWFAAYDAEGYFYPVDGIPAFLGGYDEEGNRVAVGYAPQDESGNTIDFVMAGYVIDFGANQYGVLSDPTTLLTFPVTITPATKATTYAVKEFKGGKKTLNPLAPKTFKTYGLCEMSYRTF